VKSLSETLPGPHVSLLVAVALFARTGPTLRDWRKDDAVLPARLPASMETCPPSSATTRKSTLVH
jgi:hypothetical protein